MALNPVQQLSVPFISDYNGYFFKFYLQGTTTPLAMATDSTGDTTLAKAEISSGGTVPQGFIKTAGGNIFIPYVDSSYDAFVFPTAAEADANDFSNAVQLADNMSFFADVKKNFNTVALMVSDNFLAIGDIVETSGYISAGDGGNNVYEVVEAGTGTDDGGSFIDLATHQARGLFPADVITIKQFGGIGDGVVDDITAINAALAMKQRIHFPAGNYRHTETITMNDSHQIIGAGVNRGQFAIPTNEWEIDKNTWFTYDGATDAAGAQFLVSSYAIGVEPTGTQLDAANLHMEAFGIDGNGKIGFGCYFVRPNGIFKNVTVVNTLEHAFLYFNTGGCSFDGFAAINNFGNGFTLGRNIYSWSNLFADESTFIRPFSLLNGRTGTFDDATPTADGYGFGIFNSRGLTFVGYECSGNDGPGIWFENASSGQILFSGGYSEFNCKTAKAAGRAVEEWGFWYEGSVAGLNQRNVKIDTAHFKDYVRLTGTEPGREFSAGPVFQGLGYLQGVDADWDNYQLINCNESLTLDNVLPSSSIGHFGLDDMYALVGVGAFNATSGAIVSDVHAGIVDNVTRTSAGIYVINFKAGVSLTAINYRVSLTSGPGRIIGVVTKGTTSVTIDNRTDSATLTDSSAVIGYDIVKITN